MGGSECRVWIMGGEDEVGRVTVVVVSRCRSGHRCRKTSRPAVAGLQWPDAPALPRVMPRCLAF